MSHEQTDYITNGAPALPLEVEKIQLIEKEIGKVLIGQEYLINRLLIGLICNQHILIEGVPGLAKTLSVNTLAKTLGLGFKRIQFTPDLLPADIIGTLIYNPKTGEFTPKKGPVFSNLILADEINRAPAKVQSALLESMQERQVTIGNETYKLEQPFMVMATQNPIEQEGTYPLPEAQLDRFMLKVKITYPDRSEELEILRLMAKADPQFAIETVATSEEILAIRSFLDTIHVEPILEEFIVDIIQATRNPALYGIDAAQLLRYGASPRATIYLTMAAKASALLKGRSYVIPDDITELAYDILRHRIIISYEAEAEELTPDGVIKIILDAVPAP